MAICGSVQLRGVCVYNGETFTHFTEMEGLGNDYVTSMLEDRIGNLWFGTSRGGVSYIMAKLSRILQKKRV